VTGDAEVSAHDLDEFRIALDRPDRSHVPDEPNQEPATQRRRPMPSAAASVPLTMAMAMERGAPPMRIGSVSARCSGVKAWDLFDHRITTPPPNEKNDRKKLDAANAIDKPNTIWISLRKPPDVSPHASDSPVEMMMMTAMILAKGPWTDCRIWLSGCSHGMLELAAWAGLTQKQAMTNVVVEAVLRSNEEAKLMIGPPSVRL
jgi:hypothetical protein